MLVYRYSKNPDDELRHSQFVYRGSYEGDVIMHGRYKYKDKYRGKNGKWIYIYEDVKKAISDYGKALSSKDEWLREQRAKTTYTTMNDELTKSQKRRDDAYVKMMRAKNNKSLDSSTRQLYNDEYIDAAAEVSSRKKSLHKNAMDYAKAKDATAKAKTISGKMEAVGEVFMKRNGAKIQKAKNWLANLFGGKKKTTKKSSIKKYIPAKKY